MIAHCDVNAVLLGIRPQLLTRLQHPLNVVSKVQGTVKRENKHFGVKKRVYM